MNHFRLAVCIPSGPMMHTDMALCLINMLLAFPKLKVPGYNSWSCKIINKRTSLLPKSRQGLLDDAIYAKCSHALFLDTDQTFPANIPQMLARHGKRIIGCNVATKIMPSSPTARNHNPNWAGGDVVYSNGKTGVEKVWRLGTGIMLIHLDTVRALPKPWFATVWNEELQDFTGEDWYFNEQLEAAGVPIWVDHDASLQVGHIGNYHFEHKDVRVLTQEELEADVQSQRRAAA